LWHTGAANFNSTLFRAELGMQVPCSARQLHSCRTSFQRLQHVQKGTLETQTASSMNECSHQQMNLKNHGVAIIRLIISITGPVRKIRLIMYNSQPLSPMLHCVMELAE
jgi:hypothetical protein